jgi:hypothetical protein
MYTRLSANRLALFSVCETLFGIAENSENCPSELRLRTGAQSFLESSEPLPKRADLPKYFSVTLLIQKPDSVSRHDAAH